MSETTRALALQDYHDGKPTIVIMSKYNLSWEELREIVEDDTEEAE